MANSKHKFVPGDQGSPLLVFYCLLILQKISSLLLVLNCYELFLSAYFIF